MTSRCCGVRGLAAVTPDASIVEAVIAMARGLKVGVIAEGVETREQAELPERAAAGDA